MFRHRFDPSALVAGVIFLGVAQRYLVEGSGGRSVSFDWAAPAVLAGLALIAVLRVVFRSRRRDSQTRR